MTHSGVPNILCGIKIWIVLRRIFFCYPLVQKCLEPKILLYPSTLALAQVPNWTPFNTMTKNCLGTSVSECLGLMGQGEDEIMSRVGWCGGVGRWVG